MSEMWKYKEENLVISLFDSMEAILVISQLWEMLKCENIAHFETCK
jgi:hypothetical protein